MRIISGQALGVEAMGFGDVTLMAMIGAFLGWQAVFLVFFLAPWRPCLASRMDVDPAASDRLRTLPEPGSAHRACRLGWRVDPVGHLFSLGWFIPATLPAAW